MINRISEPVHSEIGKAYKNFKLPILQVSKPQFCNKVLHDFRKSLEKDKSSSGKKKQYEPETKQIIKRLKLVSLIKTDKKSLSTIPVNQAYCPYRRVSRIVQTDFRKLPKKKEIKSQDRVANKLRCKTEDESLLVHKMDMNINLSQFQKLKANYGHDRGKFHSQRGRKVHKRSETEAIYNFTPVSERMTKRSLMRKNKIQFIEETDLFLTEGNERQQDHDLLQYQQPGILTQKPQQKLPKFSYSKKPSLESRMLNESIRGWTRYNKASQHSYLDEINQDSIIKKRQKFL